MIKFSSSDEDSFITIDKKPRTHEKYRADGDFFIKKRSLAIVMQGSILHENDFTLETVKIYKETFAECPIIVSTWQTEPQEAIWALENAGAIVLKNAPPEVKCFDNTNYQIKSTQAGLKKAKDIGVKYVIKTRTDQRMYETNLPEYFMDLQETFPLDTDIKTQQKRLIAISLNTFKYRLYDISDMFLFGTIDDVLNFWSCDYERRTVFPPFETILDYCKSCPCEIGFTISYLERIGYNPTFTLKDSWESYAKYFCVIDASSVGLYWPKYTNETYRWRNFFGNNRLLEELTFKEWLSLYNHTKKYIPEHILKMPYNQPYKEKPSILQRTACLGIFTLQKLNTSVFNCISFQKNRIDYCLEVKNNPEFRVDIDSLEKYAKKEWTLSLLFRTQQKDIFGVKNANILLMDSFSELTDKLFINKKTGKRFCAHFSDINTDTDFNELYNCLGMLSLEEMEKAYDSFFSQIVKSYGNIPIIYLHFPTDFETREEFILRARKIKETIAKLSEKYSNILSINVDFLERAPEDDFPYHFSEKTYNYIARKLASTKLFELPCIVMPKSLKNRFRYKIWSYLKKKKKCGFISKRIWKALDTKLRKKGLTK
ncbi:WavE lipopolysaccharide synthesis family protein [Endomicrobium proavitum]|nr:WavE lipopolysaccharide synthesis family protein [Endomicrobium proavitum]